MFGVVAEIFIENIDNCYNEFVMRYFQVLYQSEWFLDKNKDYVVAEHQELLSASKCPFVSGLFPPQPEETSKTSKFSSIGSRFKVHILLYSAQFLGVICLNSS